MGCCPQSAPRAVRAIPQGACHDARRQIGMTQSPVPTRNRPPHLGTRAVCPCLQFNTKTPQPISVCLEHAPEAATPAQTKYLWVIERWVNARKDDGGSRTIQASIKSGSTTGTSGTDVALGTNYQYLMLQSLTDPNTGAAWTLPAVNAAEFGIKITN